MIFLQDYVYERNERRVTSTISPLHTNTPTMTNVAGGLQTMCLESPFFPFIIKPARNRLETHLLEH
jgi:hypothetical protein